MTRNGAAARRASVRGVAGAIGAIACLGLGQAWAGPPEPPGLVGPGAPEQPRTEQPRAEQPRAEQPGAEQPRAEQPGPAQGVAPTPPAGEDSGMDEGAAPTPPAGEDSGGDDSGMEEGFAPTPPAGAGSAVQGGVTPAPGLVGGAGMEGGAAPSPKVVVRVGTPEGAAAARAGSNTRTHLIAAGAGLLGGFWAASALAAGLYEMDRAAAPAGKCLNPCLKRHDDSGGRAALLFPIAGPFVAMGTSSPTGAEAAGFAALGIGQAVGVGLLVGGLLMPQATLPGAMQPQKAGKGKASRVQVTPTFSPDRFGLSVSGRM